MSLRLICCAAGLVLFGLLASLRGGQVYAVTGVVRAPLQDGRIVVAHEDIAGYMPAMTMGFDVAANAVPAAAALRVGDRVGFSLRVDEAGVEADGFKVTGHAAEPASRSRGPAIRRLHEGDVLPPLALVDEQNQRVTTETLSGHVTILTFIFTRCPVPEFCPLVSRRFGELQRAIGTDPALRARARLLSVTLDPEFDRPAVLAAYGKAVGADPAIWRFATGETTEVDALVKVFSVYKERNGVTLDHTLCTALIDSTGHVAEIWRGNGWTTSEVLEALRAAR